MTYDFHKCLATDPSQRWHNTQSSGTLFEGLQNKSITDGIKEGTEEEEAGEYNSDGKKIDKSLEILIRSILCVPLNNILYTGFLINSNFHYLPHNNPLIHTVIHNISQQIMDTSIYEICLYSRKISPVKLIYTAN